MGSTTQLSRDSKPKKKKKKWVIVLLQQRKKSRGHPDVTALAEAIFET
jgi:hypothetical protein